MTAPLRRAAALAAGVATASPAVPAAAAKLVEDGGYKYVQIGLSGLWGGFFVFLIGIAFCLIGLFLVLLWRRAARAGADGPVPKGAEEEDRRVF